MLPVLPGTEHASHPRGFHAVVPAAGQASGSALQAEVALDLVGTGDLAFAPVAGTTRIDLASDWPHPSFAGRFLPNDRTVTAQGSPA
jgi:inner membrane protein